MGTITSMTGFGTGSADADGYRLRASIRSVNGRFLDLQIRCQGGLVDFEQLARERVQASKGITRGKVNVTLEWEETPQSGALPVLSDEVAAQYLEELKRLSDIAGVALELDLHQLARMPGLFRTQETVALDDERTTSLVAKALEEAIGEFARMREAEGKALLSDLKERLAKLEACIEEIAKKVEGAKEQIHARLRERVEILLRPGELDESRLAMEVALLADRSDITEEIVRFRSHNQQFANALDEGGDVGKRLNFLLQEMHREANTISSKASDVDLIHQTVEIKEEVERLREQIQNLA